MPNSLCLVVDDEPDLLELLIMTLEQMKIDCYAAETLKQAKEHLHSHHFDLCLTDMRLPDGNGMELVAYIVQNYPQTPVAMITAYGSIESAVQALKTGAFDFITKPLKVLELRNLVNSALQLPKSFPPTRLHHDDIKKIFSNSVDIHSRLIGHSQAILQLRAQIQKLARSQAPVHIRGESGTGKEVVARLIHSLSSRADKPFVPVNCGAIPGELLESEFFGHLKGSFTGAHVNKLGLFQVAQGGTLFLDEIADLPLPMQVKLLRVIQDKQVRQVGSTQEVSLDVRILSAAHRDLSTLVKQSKFREDLFYRINVIEVFIPPLRERNEDIPDLVDNILKKMNLNSVAHRMMFSISPSALEKLNKYSFPGNVRELENILERAMTLCENNVIDVKDLQLPGSETQSMATSNEQPPQLAPLLEDIEKETILNALKQTKGNKTQAAQLLGISIGALRYRLQKLQVGKQGSNC
jgi:two-component system response regulator PilR (NtrC family)